MTNSRAGDAVEQTVPADQTVSAQELEDALFDEFRAHVESMIAWARSEPSMVTLLAICCSGCEGEFQA